MFDIGFSELLLVGLVALLVFGPERLPAAARTAGLWVGRLKRSFNAIKTEVEREIGADEIRRQLHNEQILQMERELKQSLQPPAPATAPTTGSAADSSAATPTASTPQSAAPDSTAAAQSPPSAQPASAPAAPSEPPRPT
ncbi:Sec-independent protein translocase protein TatB [Pseudomonas sp. MAP12]|uniref:Sec-independent protein translocase protein TatB n=1 Tax=Geopseudomonas aromaticivorans TaxID=2849492 RepID=A0ABS6MXI6_9GAMM|nr:Sec-independent protein translocase protein TatB [Pseudomonas aromaticivorans]MBV2133527.1 Sec-independent protein translocase protein TatB [Pseudomonas aromaticivorans]